MWVWVCLPVSVCVDAMFSVYYSITELCSLQRALSTRNAAVVYSTYNMLHQKPIVK